MQYHHRQVGTVIISVVGIVLVFFLIRYLTIESIQPAEVWAGVILLVALCLFASLTVEIKDRTIICYFGPGLIRRTIALSDIREVRPVRNSWFLGWGIRWMPGRYWLWNVSGFEAVELTLTNGKQFRIGTDEPDSLIQAIQINKAA